MNPTASAQGQSWSTFRRVTWRQLLLGAALFVGAAFLAARPDSRLVEHVEFVGASRAGLAELRHLAEVRNGDTLLGVDLEAVRRGVGRHPWVEGVSVRRVWPDTLVIEVDEYDPVALLRRGALHYIDDSGEVFLPAASDDLDYPILTGAGRELERAHPALPGAVIREALALLEALETRDLVASDAISEVQFLATRGFTLTLLSGAEVRLGLGRQDEQLDRLAALLTDGVRLDVPVLVDLAPASVAIVRPLLAEGEG